MQAAIVREYTRQRRYGVPAYRALSNAKTKEAFNARDNVRLRIELDESADIDDLKGDTYNPRVNPEIPLARLKREEHEFEQRIERDGVVGIIGEYFDGDEWQETDAVWGFVGSDREDSGYDYDIMAATLEAAINHETAQKGAV